MFSYKYGKNEIRYALGHPDDKGLWGMKIDILLHSDEETTVKEITTMNQYETIEKAAHRGFILGKRIIDGEIKVRRIQDLLT